MDERKILTVILAIILIIPVGRKWYDFLAYRFFDIGFVSSSPLNFEKLVDVFDGCKSVDYTKLPPSINDITRN